MRDKIKSKIDLILKTGSLLEGSPAEPEDLDRLIAIGFCYCIGGWIFSEINDDEILYFKQQLTPAQLEEVQNHWADFRAGKSFTLHLAEEK
jgi:hypothetical protein